MQHIVRTTFYKFIYNPQVNKLLRSLSKTILDLFGVGYMLPVSGKISYRLRSGKTLHLCTNQTDFVSKWIYYKGLYDYEYVAIFEKLLPKCKAIIDIGCNAGLYSILAGVSAKSSIRVLSFDPSSASNHFMRINIELNNVSDSVSYFNIALSNFNGKHTFFEVSNPKYPFEKYNLGGASSLVNKPEDFVKNEVSVSRLDDFLIDQRLSELEFDLIKIDAEGAEPKIIEGMKDLLIRCRPILICEILLGSDEDELSDAISEYGYNVFFFKDGHLERAEDLHTHTEDKVRNCFLVPDSKMDWMVDLAK